MELGAVICRPRKPLCNQCPVHQICRAFAQNLQQEFPVKKKKQKIPQYHIAVGVLRKGEKVLITRRAENGLLGGLWEFPGGKVRDGETAAEACIREFKEEVNLAISIESYLTRVKHAYSHFRIVMDVFVCNYVSGRVKLKGVEDFRWITLNEINQFPFPKANHKLLPWLRKFYE
ncbi:MAG: NUDIX domain-containing protein [Calditrichae bacterium]|nr:NUDIX domain-containing protein [Calditrichia bacterium]